VDSFQVIQTWPYWDDPAAKEGLDLGIEGRGAAKSSGIIVPVRRQFSLQPELGVKWFLRHVTKFHE
jgi:hypothetical protein